MKALVPFLTKLYQYATAFIVVASPLFFVPGTGFAPEVTYYITMMVALALASVSYAVTALITRSWHSVSRLEFISYFAFSLAVLLSVIFARDQRIALFGEAFNPLSGLSLLSLPMIVYLVRTLPDTIRLRLKYVFAVILSAAVFIFIGGLMISGTFLDIARQLFAGFSTALSFAAYLGIFTVAILFFSKKARFPVRYKIPIIVGTVFIITWIVSVGLNDGVRPNFSSSMSVAKQVLAQEGIFGIGAGDYERAWQLYRPQGVVLSPYFGQDFSHGFSAITTLFTTIGIVGLLGFLMLTLTALYSTYRSYRHTADGEDHVITGMLALTLLYLTIVAWVIPLSFAMFVVWMVVAGLGLAKARLSEYHPSRKLAYVIVPIAVLIAIHAGFVVQKARAFALFGEAQVLIASSGPAEEAGQLFDEAISAYAFDGFYRAKIEYLISANRQLLSTPSEDQTEFQNKYLENTQAAVNAGLEAVKLNGNNYQNYVSLGRAYELAIPFEKEAGFARAKQSYEEAVKLYPTNPYLHVMLARLEASAGTKDGVRVQLTEALSKKQNFADALYLMSQLEASEQKIEEALAYAIEAVRNAPNDPLVYVQAGLLYYGKGDFTNASGALTAALEKDPNNANIAYFLALSLRDAGRLDLAKPLVEELLNRSPDNADLKALAKSLED